MAILRRLRERFLDGTAGDADYWSSESDLALYDATFGERIGWKWDAVLSDLAVRGWQPRSRAVLDWACGSGVAGRRVAALWPGIESLALDDRSPLAVRFAAAKARELLPHLRISSAQAVPMPETLLVLSHVISELPPREKARLIELAKQAGQLIWVEAGTYTDSRRLIEVREALRNEFVPIAPCTHREACGLQTAVNAAHWCHHFARPPSSVFQDARWVEWGREMGIDLRSLPYSYLVLERRPAKPQSSGFSRIIGRPREAKGHLKILSCQSEGVSEFMLQKRDAPPLFKDIRKGNQQTVYRWRLREGKIIGTEGNVANSGACGASDPIRNPQSAIPSSAFAPVPTPLPAIRNTRRASRN